jgi:putative membrane protein
MVTSASEEHERFTVKVTSDSHFAWFRTRLALERTIMAWVRTAVALIGFGFTIVQFFERLSSLESVAPPSRPFAARYVGLVLIATGVLVLIVSVWQYRAVVRYLWHGDFAAIAGLKKTPGHTPVYAIAVVMIFVGVFAFLVVLVRAV